MNRDNPAGELDVELDVRTANATDLVAIARVHKTAYSRNHFTALMPEWTLVEYYREFLGQGTTIRIVSDKRGDAREVIGFAVFGCGIPDKIKRFKAKARPAILVTAVRYPAMSARKAARAAISRLSAEEAKPPADFLLLSLAVSRKGMGIGTALLRDMAQEAKNLGHERIGLYVNCNNIGAINAYCTMGYRFIDLVDRQYYMEVGV